MDAQARKKALFRAKLKDHAQKQDKRIDSPLVRYNEFDQPVCRVCDIILKSESFWAAHQASRKHHEAINNVKANAGGLTRVNNVKPAPPAELPKPKPEPECSTELRNAKPEPSTELPKPWSSSSLPADFFDNHEMKRRKTGTDAVKSVDPDSFEKTGGSAQTQAMELFDSEINSVQRKISESQPARELTQTSKKIVGSETKQVKKALPEEFFDNNDADLRVGSETKQVKGALPEGFFDNKDADLRARGIKLVKPDVKDEYKEFEKLIQEDLQEVDNRMEEEEFDAAETIEEAESLEQKTYWKKVEMLKKKKMELKAARSATRSRGPEVISKESSHDSSSSDDDNDENFAVDWRAKHL